MPGLVCLVLQAVPAEASWLQVVIQGGALALLGYLVVVVGPGLAREARQEREAAEARWQATVDRLGTGMEARASQLGRSLSDLTESVGSLVEREQATLAELGRLRADMTRVLDRLERKSRPSS